MSEWWHNLDQQAKRLQRQNKHMRLIYGAGLILQLMVMAFFNRALGAVLALFFAALLIVNERLIRKMRKAGYP